MASSKTPRMCILPGSQITVTALDRVDGNSKINIMDMMDTVTIATMEEFQGFGAWFTKPFCQLWMPPVLPESFSDQELKTQLEQKRRVVEFYHMVFNNANRDLEPANDANCELDRSVYLPLLYADGNHGGLMVDLLVQALTTFEFDCPFHVLKEVVVVGKGSAVEDLLTILDAQLKEIALPRRISRRNSFSFGDSVRQQRPAENAVEPSDNQPSLPHPSSQSQSAGQSGDSSSQARPARSSGTGKCFAMLFSEAYKMRYFFYGSFIIPFGYPFQCGNASHWNSVYSQSNRVNSQSRGGNVESSITFSHNSDRVELSARETPGPQPWVQYFYLFDECFSETFDFELPQSAYLVSRKTHTMTGKVDTEDEHCIWRCLIKQRTEIFHDNGLDSNVTDTPHVGRYRKAARTPQSDRSDTETAAMDGETARRYDSGTTESQQASSVQVTTPGSGEKELSTDGDDERAVSLSGEEESSEDGDDEHAVSLSGEEESSEDGDDTCAICLSAFQRPTQLKNCGHVFCRQCLEDSFRHHPRCPLCRGIIVESGNTPDGDMTVYGSPIRLPGYEEFTTIVLDYRIYEIRQAVRPNPGEIHVAYLPASEEGFKVCRLLWVAFKFRLTFFWERISNLIMWNVDHKTSVNDDSPQNPGYPDHDYLRNVTDKLAKMGITEKFMQGFSIPF